MEKQMRILWEFLWVSCWKSYKNHVGILWEFRGKSYGKSFKITNFLTENCGYFYLLTSFLQTDPLEHHFGLYRMMLGANYHISYLQILESERSLKVSNILNICSSNSVSSTSSLQEFIQSFSSMETSDRDSEVDLDPFLCAISDLSPIECSIQVLQSLAFIAGYLIHRYLKCSKPCRICRKTLTFGKDLLIDDLSKSHFTLFDLSDRESLKYPSEIMLESIVIVWKIFVSIESNDEFMTMLVKGPSRKILVDLSANFILNSDSCDMWNNTCSSCAISGSYVLQKLIFVAVNYFLSNKVKNYNSMVVNKCMENRKLKKFNK